MSATNEMSGDLAEQWQEARLRRRLAREGYGLRRSRGRVATPDDRLGYRIVDAQHNVVRTGQRFDLTLDDVERWADETEGSALGH